MIHYYTEWKHEIILLPKGDTALGTNKPHFPADSEGPLYNFTLDRDLWVDKYEVTNEQFAAFVAETRFVTEAEKYGWSFVHELQLSEAVKKGISSAVAGAEWWLPVNGADWLHAEGPGSDVLSSGRGNHPVVHVSQRDATVYCMWAGGGRLPLEDEWEYMARGGDRGAADEKFPWGDRLLSDPPPDPAKARVEVGAKGGSKPVATPAEFGFNASRVVLDPKSGRRHRMNVWQGEFPMKPTPVDGHLWTAPVDALGPQNQWGFHHVLGNVWEWTNTNWCPPATRQVPRSELRRFPNPARKIPPDCPRPTPQPKPKPTPLGEIDDGKYYYDDEDPGTPVPAPSQPDEGEVEVVKRGGSFLCHRDSCYRYRLPARHKNTRNSSASNVGFRCVWDGEKAGVTREKPLPKRTPWKSAPSSATAPPSARSIEAGPGPLPPAGAAARR